MFSKALKKKEWGIDFSDNAVEQLYGEDVNNEDKNIWILKSTYPGVASPFQGLMITCFFLNR